MEQFLDIGQYTEVLSEFKKTHAGVAGNITATKKELKRVIDEKRLFYAVSDHTLCIFRDELDYWSVMLMTDGLPETVTLPNEKPCSAVVMYPGGKMRKDAEMIKEKLESLKFSFLGEYSLYKYDVAKGYSIVRNQMNDLAQIMESNGYRMLPMKEEYRDEIHEFIRRYLPRHQFPKEQWEFEIKDREIFLMYDMNQAKPKLIGMKIVYQQTSSYGYATAFAVDPDYRKQMVAIFMSYRMIEWAYEAGIPVLYGWISDSNRSSIAVSQAIGSERTSTYYQDYYLVQ